MPTLPIAPGTARCELIYDWDGQTVENVWFNGGADNAIGTLVEIADIMMDLWRLRIMPMVSEQVTLQKARVTYLGTANGNSIEQAAPADSNGQEISASLPNNVSVAVKLLTGLGGRSRRGRKFHIGLCENQVIASHLDTAFRADLVQEYQSWVDAMLVSPYPLVVVSYYLNGALRTEAQITPITNITIDPTIDSQRRRLPGRGT